MRLLQRKISVFFDYADFNIAQALIEDFGASRSLQIAYHLIAHCQKY